MAWLFPAAQGPRCLADEYAGKFETGASAPVTPHLKFLDGLRGIAALYVVIHHSCQASYVGLEMPGGLFFLRWGRAAVTIFIAISGYCLGLPVVRAGFTLRGGTLHFYGKRARRILAPYYVALAAGIAMCVFLLTPAGLRLAWLSNPFIIRAIIAHIFMVHNWSPNLAYMFNGPLWSVATEVQIYLIFPSMVLLWRRWGSIYMLICFFVASHLALYLSGHRGSINYLFVFALGAYAAERSLDERHLRALKITFYICLIGFLALPDVKEVYQDLIVGVGISCMMTLCARSNFWPRAVLSLRLFTWLGGFSYSIYLIHAVIQTIYLDTRIGLLPRFPPGPLRLLFMCFGLTPIILGLSYLFHLAVERPFMTVHKPRALCKVPEVSLQGDPRIQ
jgi:peptidoglycan/LPS O-acetylase OafA/YrhL